MVTDNIVNIVGDDKGVGIFSSGAEQPIKLQKNIVHHRSLC
jgi:hypothetical protein